MDHSRRALYNSLRQNWLLDSTLAVEPWQVEDYRSLSLKILFERLKLQNISLDKEIFLSLAETVETPEELTEQLLKDELADAITQDQVYLLVFELWRRLVPEKLSLSLFCDELDHQIYLYDTGQIEHPDTLEDALSNLRMVLEENADHGIDPVEAFKSISSGCANSIESFLYDFISEQIDESNESYANELLEAFKGYVSDTKWFDFLKARLMISSDPIAGDRLIHELIKDNNHTSSNLEFNLDVLTFMIQEGSSDDFRQLVKKTLPLLRYEEDFQDLLLICADFYHRLDQEELERAIQAILNKRAKIPLRLPFEGHDPLLEEFVRALSI
jgi:hypothetical protein